MKEKKMKIGIIVHSHTGHTLEAAEKIGELLVSRGEDAKVLKVTAEGDGKDKSVVLTDKPSVEGFDALIFGAPVWAFSLTPVMNEYLSQVDSLKGKKVACFITQSGGPLLGGNRTIKQMKALCKGKGADIALTEIIRWKDEGLKQRVEAAAEKLCAIAK
jgi:flavodoxin